MTPLNGPPTSISLRVVTQRLASTPTERLPQVVSDLASTISDCGELLAASSSQNNISDGSEISLLIHKLKTQVSTLLQSKGVESRWAAVILIKAVVDAAGWEMLRAVGPWVRGLLGLLGRPEPSTTKKLCIVTLSRIFILTREYPSLVREITTPCLPAFVTCCLNQITIRASVSGAVMPKVLAVLLSTVLESFCELVPRYPNTFRPFTGQIKSLAVPLLAATPSSLATKQGMQVPAHVVSASLANSARRLFVLLHHCAPKNTLGDNWAHTMHQVIETTHATADQVLRALIEDWEPTSTRPAKKGSNSKAFGETVGDVETSPLDLPSWKGIYGGLERIVGLLNMIQTYLATETAFAVAIPIGRLLDLSNRLLLICPPVRGKPGDIGTRVNPEIVRDEREGLWDGIPKVHLAVIEFLTILVIRCGDTFAASSHGVLEQVVHTMLNQQPESRIRISYYTLIRHLLQKFGPSLTSSMTPLISRALRICCNDLLYLNDDRVQGDKVDPGGSKKTQVNRLGIANADSYLKQSRLSPVSTRSTPKTQDAAATLLSTSLTHLPSGFLSFSMQSHIERTAILTKHERMMFASAIHPFTTRDGQTALSSTLPIFARAFPYSLEVEALLRPRMPVLRPKISAKECDDSDCDEDIGFSTSTTAPIDYGHSSHSPYGVQGTKLRSPNVVVSNPNDGSSRQEHSNVNPQISKGNAEPYVNQDHAFINDNNKRPWTSFSDKSNTEAAPTKDVADEDPTRKQKRLDPELASGGFSPTVHLAANENSRYSSTEMPVIDVPAIATQVSSGMAEMTGIIYEDEESDFEVPPLVLASDSDDEGDDVVDKLEV